MRKVRKAALRMGVKPGPEMSFLLASAHIESKMWAHNQPNALALHHNNIFGIKWIPRDEGVYGYVETGPNPYETERGVDRVRYRVYDSLEHCVENWLWHVNFSKHHKSAKVEAYRTWAFELGHSWQRGNPSHASEVRSLYNQYLETEF
jgi:hypothetical protein